MLAYFVQQHLFLMHSLHVPSDYHKICWLVHFIVFHFINPVKHNVSSIYKKIISFLAVTKYKFVWWPILIPTNTQIILSYCEFSRKIQDYFLYSTKSKLVYYIISRSSSFNKRYTTLVIPIMTPISKLILSGVLIWVAEKNERRNKPLDLERMNI